LSNAELTLKFVEFEVEFATSLKNLLEAFRKFCVNNYVVNRNSHAFDAKQNLFHHILKGLARITKPEGSAINNNNNIKIYSAQIP